MLKELMHNYIGSTAQQESLTKFNLQALGI